MSKDSQKSPAPPVDVDEDVDDLDDVLEQFNAPLRPATKPPGATQSKPQPVPTELPAKKAEPAALPPSSSSTAATTASAPTSTALKLEDEADAFGDEFAAELAAGMEALMRDLGRGPSENDQESTEDTAAMRAAWEKMLMAGMDEAGNGGVNLDDLSSVFGPDASGPSEPSGAAKSAGPAPPNAAASGSSSSNEDAFQRTIRQAVEKLKDSEDTLKAGSADTSDPLSKLLADLNLNDLGLGGEGGQGENGEDVQSMLEGLLAQLVSKELLYEPLKELDSKFPGYLKDHEKSLSAADKTRYQKQSEKVHEIVAMFDRPGYSDDKPEDSMEVLRLMNEMQSYGSPPTEIMGDLPPGMTLGADGLPTADGCIIC